MDKQESQPSAFRRLSQRLTSSRPAAWFFARCLHPLDRLTFRLSRQRFTLTGAAMGLPMVLLTTTGAKSGLPRTMPLLRIDDPQHPGTFALIASNFGQKHSPGWYFNLKANSKALCSIQGQEEEYIAHEAMGEEYARFWQLAARTYLGYPLYQQRAGGRHIPIMVMRRLE